MSVVGSGRTPKWPWRKEFCDLSAADHVLAGHAGNVGTRAADPSPLDHDRLLSLLGQSPSDVFARFAAAKHDEVIFFGLRSWSVHESFFGCERSVILFQQSKRVVNHHFFLNSNGAVAPPPPPCSFHLRRQILYELVTQGLRGRPGGGSYVTGAHNSFGESDLLTVAMIAGSATVLSMWSDAPLSSRSLT